MSSPAEVFAVERATYKYLDRFVALDEVSLRIIQGERVALLGANGCGKSTLLKLLAGLLHADRGSVRAFGADLDATALDDEQFARTFRTRVGFVFQNSDAQLFSPTVREEIAFGPLHLGLERPEVDQRVADLLELLDIGALADRAPYQLSGGEKKRVAIASVLATNPDVLLFDEPTAALDPRTQHWLLDLIGDLHRAGKTIVCATHELATLGQVADRCVVFSENHRIAATGTPAEILADAELLQVTNLVHVHEHRHPNGSHTHLHDLDHHRSGR
jgi:cobalt/nickel transport system ATP-binding protein